MDTHADDSGNVAVEARLLALVEADDAAPQETVEGASDEQAEGQENAETETPETGEIAESDTGSIRDDLRLTVDGEEATLADLKAAFKARRAATADYTKKTMAVAEERKEAERLKAAYAERLELMETALKQGAPAERSPEEWASLRASDPAEYAAQRAEATAREQKLGRINEERARLAAEQAETRQRELVERLQGEQQRLHAAIPEWSDPTVRQTEQQALIEFGQRVGFAPEELLNVTDHRAVLILRQAMMYDKLKAQPPQKKAPAAKTLKPGTQSVPKPKADAVVAARQRLAKTGDPRAAEEAFFKMLEAGQL